MAACCKMAGWDEGAVCGEQAARANINRNAHMNHVREKRESLAGSTCLICRWHIRVVLLQYC